MKLNPFRKQSMAGKAKVIHKWFNNYAKLVGVSSISSKEILELIEKTYWGAINTSRYYDTKNIKAFRKLASIAVKSHADWVDQHDSHVVDVLFNRRGLTDDDAKRSLRDAIYAYHRKRPTGYYFNVCDLAINPQRSGITLFSDPLPDMYEAAIELYNPVWKAKNKGSVWLLNRTNPADVRAELHVRGIPRLDVICIDESTSEVPDILFASGSTNVSDAVIWTEEACSGDESYDFDYGTYYGLVHERCRLIMDYREPQLMRDFSFAEFERCCLKHGLLDRLGKFDETFASLDADAAARYADKESLHALMMERVKSFFMALEPLYPKKPSYLRSVQKGIMDGRHYLYSFKNEKTMMLIGRILCESMGELVDEVPYEYGASHQVFVEAGRTARFAIWLPCQRRGIPFNWNLFYPTEFDEQSSAAAEDYEHELREMIGWVDAFVVAYLYHHDTPVKNAIREVVADGDNRADLVILR